ncbi:MAG TPA: hypothetical protein VHN78_11185, partial [Chloroflexota bacterium]|nr:hypothetical protein [Chloroflexota bacterium]
MSLLWPPGQPPKPGPRRLDTRTIEDLDLHELVLALTGHDQRREPFVMDILAELCTSAEVIRYRQHVLADLLEDATLRQRLGQVRAALEAMVQERGQRQRASWSVSQIARRVRELEQYVEATVQLQQCLEDARPSALAFRLLRDHVRELTATPEFRALQAELPTLRATIDRARSVTIGINLTDDLSPDSATVIDVSAERVEGRAPLLERLFGKEGGARRGLTTLHDVDLGNPANPLYRDLRKLLEKAIDPVQEAIGRYTSINAYALVELEAELSLLLNAAALARRLEAAGLPVCRPEVAGMVERVTTLQEAYNVGLALRLIAGEARRMHTGDSGETALHATPAQDGTIGVVTNALTFDATHARVWILTGPNRGGKTTYTRAVGQAHVLFQAGLGVPGSAGRLSPVDAIYTHFATQESAQVGMGRLDEEAARLATIFRVATPHGLILLNEVLAGTSTIEALGLALDAVRGLRLLGARAIYTTHLHELAARVDELNASTAGDAIVGSLVADAEAEVEAGGAVVRPRHRRTF